MLSLAVFARLVCSGPLGKGPVYLKNTPTPPLNRHLLFIYDWVILEVVFQFLATAARNLF